MNKDTFLAFIFSAILATGLVGSVYYWIFLPALQPQTSTTHHKKTPAYTPKGTRKKAFDYSNRRANVAIECTKADGTIFWTNANLCDDADLNNKISRSDPLNRSARPRVVNTKPKQGRQHKNSTSQTKRAKKPSLRGPGVSPPGDLAPECRFPVGKALELERDLSVKDNPRESIWFKDYCKYIHEARREHCPISQELFYYSHTCL